MKPAVMNFGRRIPGGDRGQRLNPYDQRPMDVNSQGDRMGRRCVGRDNDERRAPMRGQTRLTSSSFAPRHQGVALLLRIAL
jgi:hypothetical protein